MEKWLRAEKDFASSSCAESKGCKAVRPHRTTCYGRSCVPDWLRFILISVALYQVMSIHQSIESLSIIKIVLGGIHLYRGRWSGHWRTIHESWCRGTDPETIYPNGGDWVCAVGRTLLSGWLELLALRNRSVFEVGAGVPEMGRRRFGLAGPLGRVLQYSRQFF